MYIDLIIFQLINGFAGKWELLDKVGTFFAVRAGNALLLFLVILLLTDFKKYWRMVASSSIAALFVRFVLVEAFYLLHFRLRPFAYNGIKQLIPYSINQTSFPSGHASFYFALSTIIWAYNKKMGVIFYIVSFLIVIARIFVGVHWPSDVLAGIILGVLTGWILNKVFKKIHPLKYVEALKK